jgi:hypothetical protein
MAAGNQNAMSSRLLKISVCANLLLLAVTGYWALTRHSVVAAATVQAVQTSSVQSSEIPEAPTTLHWSNLESEDYPTYVANLRRAGCPEPVLRRIISADLKDLYARKAFALVQQFHHDFWDIAARENIRHNYDTTLDQQVKAFCNESDTLLQELVGSTAAEPISAPTNTPDLRLSEFLTPTKQLQLRNAVDSDQAQILSPEELAEYQLRQSTAASEVKQIYGVDFNETEMRRLAKALDDYHRLTTNTNIETDPETLEQTIRTVLGPARFAEFDRARSVTFRELYEFTSDFGLPTSTAAEMFDLRLASEKQCEQIRADRNRSPDEKQALLDELQDQLEQGMRSKLGDAVYQTYKVENGRWINAVGRL